MPEYRPGPGHTPDPRHTPIGNQNPFGLDPFGDGSPRGGTPFGGNEDIGDKPFRKRLEQSNPEFELFQRDLGALASSGGAQFIAALAQLPFLQMMGGMFPGMREPLQELLPEAQGFISPLEYGPFGSVGEQVQRQRSAGRTALSGRGLLGSGAEQSFQDATSLQEAQANRAILGELMQTLPMALQQVRQQALNNRMLREQIKGVRETGGPTFAEQLGGYAAGQLTQNLGDIPSIIAGA